MLPVNPVSSTEHAAAESLSISRTAVADAIDQAIASLEENDFHSHWQSAKQLSEQISQWGDRPIPHLIHCLRAASDPNTQWFLVRILSQFDQAEVIEAIAELLATTQSEDLQIEAHRALTRIGGSAIETVSALLDRENPIEQRILAVKVLAHIRRSQAIDPLLSVVEDSSAEIRAIALEALGSFHDPRITPVLLAALKTTTKPDAQTDTNSADVSICIEAIRTLGRRSDLLPQVDLVNPLRQCLRRQDLRIAQESAIALGRLGTKEAVAALSQTLMQPVATPVKAAIVRALGWIETESAVRSLAIAFEQSAPLIMPAIKPEIARALGQTRQPQLKSQAASPLIAWLHRENSQPTNNLSPDSLTDQSAANQSANEWKNLSAQPVSAFKQAVVSALAGLGQTDAIAALIPLLADSDLRIQMHARSALHQIDPEAARAQIQRYLISARHSNVLKDKVKESLKTW
ncbi:HEAT repeat domain-containing protein [cf. Phormidesmis sp. LEGE 11477]|uniref:HEAT repeat domain-containing protein n=1 Tax=cf. Phormidesmis sp. LEGE 11477 TaxID=1828680 RepID=UPI0018805A19|nr:HEAT repeat domain-containing protein [cf. Phormidesmis sp. LEGE 11477]MBE9063660.1 HEAT repeat domain-containing protein [cf. Phormidesmis sp. LEGE 11477]